jgi:Tfp pilus assembly protein PilX
MILMRVPALKRRAIFMKSLWDSRIFPAPGVKAQLATGWLDRLKADSERRDSEPLKNYFVQFSSSKRIERFKFQIRHNRIMKSLSLAKAALVAFTLCLLVANAHAQPNVAWQAPVTISGTSDVVTNGQYFGSWAPQDGGANGLPVNGVAFQGFSDLPGLSAGPSLDNGYNGYGSPGTTDGNYNALLQYARYSGAGNVTGTFSWKGMIPNHTYLVQFWVNDGRNIGEARSETITGGSSTSAQIKYGSDGSGPGQYIIGTFVADNSGSETLTMTPFSTGSNPDIQINLFQVRDITTNFGANVTWQTPVTISGTSDVSTNGTYFGSWAPQDGGANGLPVNGVTFQGFSDLPGFAGGSTFDNGYNGFGSPNTPDGNYNALLQYARFSNEGNTPASITWGGMTPGATYLVQFWVNDGRNIGQARSETLTGGTNTSASVSFGSDGSGPGQYIIGTFVADKTGVETLVVNAFSSGANPDPQVNLLQVRDITPRFSRISVTGTTLNFTATNGPANGLFVLLQSANVTTPRALWTPVLTNSFDASGNVTLSTNVINPSNPREFYILKTQ